MKRFGYVTESPVGPLAIVVDGEKLVGLWFSAALPKGVEVNEQACRFVSEQLEEYFDQKRTDFDLELAPEGTPFQLSVWDRLKEIPYGQTKAYSDIAEELGNPKAVRAVGLANGRNSISIVVPCHRVIGRSGHLTGFGGGLPAKRYLLELEAGNVNSFSLFP